MLRTVDVDVETLIVVDNGGTVSRHELTQINRKYLRRTYLWKMPRNLGVPTSWNLGIKATPFSPWWLVANFDVLFPSGSLRRLVDAASPDRLVLSGGEPAWCTFAIGEAVVERVGLFDEGIHPAYWEDIDYQRRAQALGVEIVKSGVPVVHANSSSLAAGFHDRNAVSFGANAERAQARAAAGDMSSGEWSLRARRALSWD